MSWKSCQGFFYVPFFENGSFKHLKFAYFFPEAMASGFYLTALGQALINFD